MTAATLRSVALTRDAADHPALPASVDELDASESDRLRAFATREGLTMPAALAVVRRAQHAARTEARAAAVVATALERRCRGLVGVVSLDPELDDMTDATVDEILARREAGR